MDAIPIDRDGASIAVGAGIGIFVVSFGTAIQSGSLLYSLGYAGGLGLVGCLAAVLAQFV